MDFDLEKFILVGKFFLIDIDQEEEKTETGLIIPGQKKSIDFGEVIQIGDGVPESSNVKVGDRIFFAKNSAQPVVVTKDAHLLKVSMDHIHGYISKKD